MWHDLQSAVTSYGLGIFAITFGQDLTTYAALAGLLLVLVRIPGDLAKSVHAWKDLLNGEEDDGGDD